MGTTPSDYAAPGSTQTYAAPGNGWQDTRPPQAPPSGRRSALRWVVPTVAAVAVLGGGAFGALTLLGGGQPDEVIPGNAIAYLRLDMDPSLGQKAAAVRFLHDVPGLGDTLSDGDVRQDLFDRFKEQEPQLKDVSYQRDIAPWLGDRLGVAVLPPAFGEPDPSLLVAVQVTDEDKARAELPGLFPAADRPDITFRDGYALLIDKGQKSWLNSYLADGRLADDPEYQSDMAALGEQGVFSGWMDLRQVNRLSNSSTPAGLERAAGRLGRTAFALRFDSDYIELAGVGRDMKGINKLLPATGGTSSHLADLPADTAFAAELIRPDLGVRNLWKALDKSGVTMQGGFQQEVATIEQAFGLQLPQDLETLVGKRLTIAAPAQDLTGAGTPTVGARAQTKARQAERILDRIDRRLQPGGTSLPVRHRAKDGELFVATSNRYLQQLTRPGTLGDQPLFRTAVADSADADTAVFVNLDEVERQYLSDIEDKDVRALVENLDAVGFSGSLQDGNAVTYSVRLVGD